MFFTADTHFGSARTLEFSQRPFNSVEEMDNTIINNWNNLVSKDDIVYHLGDFGNYENVKLLNGKIILILGNYEQTDILKNFNNDYSAFKKYLLDLGFYEVYDKGIYLDEKIFGEKIFMTHRPLECDRSCFNLFGHIHNYCLAKKFGLNIGIDNFHFKPATEKNVNFYKIAIQKYYDDDVFCS